MENLWIIFKENKNKPIKLKKIHGMLLNKEIIKLLVKYSKKVMIGKTVLIKLDKKAHNY
jgi:hypothetical protein